MSRNNDVFQVLVTKDNLALPALGTDIGSLLPNQIGIFDANSNLAVDGATPIRDFYIAVGVDRNGDGAIDDVKKSAGQLIQSKNIKFLDFKPHTAAQPMILDITDYKAECDSEYAIKLEFRNQEIYRIQGSNQFTHTYAITTACCEGCDTCPSGNCNEITKLMKAAINADSTGLVVATAIATEPLTIAAHGVSVNYAIGDVITDADIDILIAFNENPANVAAKVCTGLRLTSVPLKVNSFCSVNLKYFKPRQTVMIPSLVEGFDCNGTVTIVQDVVFEQGLGYDIQQKEYHAGGWFGNSGPYRLSGVNGVANSVEYFAIKTVTYDQFALTYDQESLSGWKEYSNNLATIVAIPESDTVTRNAFIAVLDGLMPIGFDALADDVAAANVNPAVVEQMDALTPNTDGVA